MNPAVLYVMEVSNWSRSHRVQGNLLLQHKSIQFCIVRRALKCSPLFHALLQQRYRKYIHRLCV